MIEKLPRKWSQKPRCPVLKKGKFSDINPHFPSGHLRSNLPIVSGLERPKIEGYGLPGWMSPSKYFVFSDRNPPMVSIGVRANKN